MPVSATSDAYARTLACAGWTPVQQPSRSTCSGTRDPRLLASQVHGQKLHAPCQLRQHRSAGRRRFSTGPLRAHPAHELEQELTDAVKAEDYVRAAALRDELRALKPQNPLSALQQQLKDAISSEKFQEAAHLRDELRALTSSETVTHGVRIVTQSAFQRAQSRPERDQYLWAYRVKFTNYSKQTVQLKTRHWMITDQTGDVKHVRGPGVVGETPIIPPGESYTYTSACPLPTPTGSMEGEFGFVIKSDAEDSTAEERSIDVCVDRFHLLMEAGVE